jgi:hypothetical protein
LATRLTLAYALAWQGRGRDADAVLAEVDPSMLSETELMEWALPRAANQFWMLSEPERATAFLQTTRNRVSTPAAQTTLDALSATFAMNAGSPSRAKQIADEVLASPAADDTAVGWAAAAAAAQLATLAPVVLSVADAGDLRANSIVSLAVEELALHVRALARQLFGDERAAVAVAFAGGNLQRGSVLRKRLEHRLKVAVPGAQVSAQDVDPARGAVRGALRFLGAATG